MKVILTCGGTGGHITPALAIADMIRENRPRAEILFIGARGGMEKEMVERAGYSIRGLCVRGLSRSLTPANLKTLWMAHTAAREARHILLEFSPDIVIGTGGYASYPALRAAIECGIPCAVHESNAVAGLAVKRLSGKLSRVWLNFEDAARDLSKGSKVLTVGNPLPRGYAVPKAAPLPAGAEKMILSFGGSLGATRINQAVLEMMEREGEHSGLYHLHATGRREYEQVKNEFCKRGLDKHSQLCLVPFLADMPRQMAAADLVICRAGAMSISEIAALGRPCVLIPSPNVTGNHQYKNAMALAKKEAAICLTESELTGERLWGEAQRILADKELGKRLSESVRQFHNENVNAVLYADICRLCQKK